MLLHHLTLTGKMFSLEEYAGIIMSFVEVSRLCATPGSDEVAPLFSRQPAEVASS